MRIDEITSDVMWWYHPDTDTIIPIPRHENHALKVLWDPERFGLDRDFIDQEWEDTEDSYWIHQLAYDRGFVRLSHNRFDRAPTVTAPHPRAALAGAKWFEHAGILADRLIVEIAHHGGKGTENKISQYYDLSGNDLEMFLGKGRLPPSRGAKV